MEIEWSWVEGQQYKVVPRLRDVFLGIRTSKVLWSGPWEACANSVPERGEGGGGQWESMLCGREASARELLAELSARGIAATARDNTPKQDLHIEGSIKRTLCTAQAPPPG